MVYRCLIRGYYLILLTSLLLTGYVSPLLEMVWLFRFLLSIEIHFIRKSFEEKDNFGFYDSRVFSLILIWCGNFSARNWGIFHLLREGWRLNGGVCVYKNQEKKSSPTIKMKTRNYMKQKSIEKVPKQYEKLDAAQWSRFSFNSWLYASLAITVPSMTS